MIRLRQVNIAFFALCLATLLYVPLHANHNWQPLEVESNLLEQSHYLENQEDIGGGPLPGVVGGEEKFDRTPEMQFTDLPALYEAAEQKYSNPEL